MFKRKRNAKDFDDEIEAHLALEADELRRGSKIAVDFEAVYPIEANAKLSDYERGSAIRGSHRVSCSVFSTAGLQESSKSLLAPAFLDSQWLPATVRIDILYGSASISVA
jgi:hypothetical protein